jgi:hypothetical protein
MDLLLCSVKLEMGCLLHHSLVHITFTFLFSSTALFRRITSIPLGHLLALFSFYFLPSGMSLTRYIQRKRPSYSSFSCPPIAWTAGSWRFLSLLQIWIPCLFQKVKDGRLVNTDTKCIVLYLASLMCLDTCIVVVSYRWMLFQIVFPSPPCQSWVVAIFVSV